MPASLYSTDPLNLHKPPKSAHRTVVNAFKGSINLKPPVLCTIRNFKPNVAEGLNNFYRFSHGIIRCKAILRFARLDVLAAVLMQIPAVPTGKYLSKFQTRIGSSS